jgi:hypothetical protein
MYYDTSGYLIRESKALCDVINFNPLKLLPLCDFLAAKDENVE